MIVNYHGKQLDMRLLQANHLRPLRLVGNGLALCRGEKQMMLLLCLAGMWLAGFGLVRWMFPQPLRWSLHNVWLFSLGIGVGAGVASCLYFLALLLAGPGVTVLASVTRRRHRDRIGAGHASQGKRARCSDWAEGPAVPWYLTALFVLAAALAVTMFLGAVGIQSARRGRRVVHLEFEGAIPVSRGRILARRFFERS